MQPASVNSLIRRGDSEAEPLLTFEHEGRTARVAIVDGAVVYSGDLPVDQSARALFDALALLTGQVALQDTQAGGDEPAAWPQ